MLIECSPEGIYSVTILENNEQMAPNLSQEEDSCWKPINQEETKMERLRDAIDTQDMLLNVIATNFLRYMNSTIESRKKNKKSPPTLAQYTRHYRLGRVLQVMEELIAVENQLHNWYAGLDSHDPNENDMHNEVHEVIDTIDRETKIIHKDWGASKEAYKQYQSTLTGNWQHLEKRIARLHDCVEAILMDLKHLVEYLKEYGLLPLLETMEESVSCKFYGKGLVRTEQHVLQTLLHNASQEDDSGSFYLLDTHKLNLLLMSLPQKYLY